MNGSFNRFKDTAKKLKKRTDPSLSSLSNDRVPPCVRVFKKCNCLTVEKLRFLQKEWTKCKDINIPEKRWSLLVANIVGGFPTTVPNF